MVIWKDGTSYSRNVKERIPSVWELQFDGMRIAVHRIIHYPGWYVSCFELGINNKSLFEDNVEKAKKEALKIILEKLEEYESIKKQILNIY